MGQPFDRLEAVGLRHNHADRPAALAVEPFAIELVAKNDWRQVERVFEHAADRQRTAEHLLRIIIVVTVVKDAAQILARLREPDHFAQRHPFPDAHAERTANVQAGHHLGKSDRMFFGELHQSRKIERASGFLRQRMTNRGRMLEIRNDLDLPRFARQANLPFFLLGQRVRQRFAARDVAKFLLGREVWFETFDGVSQLALRLVGGCP